MAQWSDEKADALNIIDSLPMLLGIDEGMDWGQRYADWLQYFGIKRDPPITQEDVRRAIAYMRTRVRGEGE